MEAILLHEIRSSEEKLTGLVVCRLLYLQL